MLLGLGFQILGWTSDYVGLSLIGVACVWAVLVVPPISVRLPTVSRGSGPGLTLNVLPPHRTRRKRLKKETLELVQAIHGYLREHPDRPLSASSRLSEDATEDEQRDAWQKTAAAATAAAEREATELTALFGGRVRYVAEQFIARGMLDQSDLVHIEGTCRARHWIGGTAQRLEALALAL